ncbi:MAG TPA: hypothetical protein VGQ57_04700 [Polyangiaceae bacterium]|nr:hypothetical protein [Polyangiaceae bacterium]
MLFAAVAGAPCRARATTRAAAIEIDARAEVLIDPRAVRRLVQLELSDVTVRPAPGQRDTALFVRVLGARDGELRVELWERGLSYGSRVVVGATDSTQLVARRVALAAAELARELSDERDDQAHEAEEARQRALAAARAVRDRTRNGPRALRSGFVGVWGDQIALAGPELVGEIDLYGTSRLDLGASFTAGALQGHHSAQSYALTLGVGRRYTFGRSLALDGGAGFEASVLDFPDVYGVDGIPGQHQTWTARANGMLRVEARLSRGVRLAVGLGGGVPLRSVPIEVVEGDTRRLNGPVLLGELALVITPF